MKNNKMDKFIEITYKSNPQKIKGLREIEVPEMEETFRSFKNNLYDKRNMNLSPNKKRQKWSNVILKGAAIALVVLITSFIFSIIYDTPQARAFKFEVIKTFVGLKNGFINIRHSIQKQHQSTLPSIKVDDGAIEKIFTSLEQARNELPFRLSAPAYLPDGYKLETIISRKYVDDSYIIEQYYRNEDDGNILIKQYSNMGNTEADSTVNLSNKNIKKIKIMDEEVYIIYSSDSSFAFWYKDDMRYEVFATVPEKEFIKILKSIN